MPIPTTREELYELVTTSFAKLDAELADAGPGAGELECVDDWTVKDLLAVRLWWTERVIDWVEAGRRGEVPVTPAEGFRWSETPGLNAGVVEEARELTYRTIRGRLKRACERVLRVMDELDDHELLEPGVFEWAGKYPLARWISMNTARQYTTARTHVRKALRDAFR